MSCGLLMNWNHLVAKSRFLWVKRTFRSMGLDIRIYLIPQRSVQCDKHTNFMRLQCQDQTVKYVVLPIFQHNTHNWYNTATL